MFDSDRFIEISRYSISPKFHESGDEVEDIDVEDSQERNSDDSEVG